MAAKHFSIAPSTPVPKICSTVNTICGNHQFSNFHAIPKMLPVCLLILKVPDRKNNTPEISARQAEMPDKHYNSKAKKVRVTICGNTAERQKGMKHKGFLLSTTCNAISLLRLLYMNCVPTALKWRLPKNRTAT